MSVKIWKRRIEWLESLAWYPASGRGILKPGNILILRSIVVWFQLTTAGGCVVGLQLLSPFICHSGLRCAKVISSAWFVEKVTKSKSRRRLAERETVNFHVIYQRICAVGFLIVQPGNARTRYLKGHRHRAQWGESALQQFAPSSRSSIYLSIDFSAPSPSAVSPILRFTVATVPLLALALIDFIRRAAGIKIQMGNWFRFHGLWCLCCS